MNLNKQYKEVFKITSLLSGLQVIQILFSIIRTKIVAIFLGPSGMGIFGILNNTINTFGSLTNLGISTSGVRQISKQNNDHNNIVAVVNVLKTLAIITGLIGSVGLYFFANKMSIQLFKNEDHTSEIKILSITIFLIQITNINLSILQGLRNFKELSLANIFGNFFGLLITLPLIIIYKQKSIAYSILFTNLLFMFTTSYYVRKKIGNFNIVTKLSYLWSESKEILKVGIGLSISGVLVSLTTYFTQFFILKFGNFTELGYYTASYTLVVSYVGLILTAMSTEYYPRLCSIINYNDKLKLAVSTQSEIITLLITPIIIIFFLCSGVLINTLYTKDFITIKPLINLLIFGMIFRSISWCISFVFSAKGDTKTFLIIEILASVYSLILNIIFYKEFGLLGLGYSFILTYLIYLLHVYSVAHKRYKFRFIRKFYKIFLYCLFFISIIYFLSFIENIFYQIALSLLILTISLFYSFFNIFPEKFSKKSHYVKL